MLSAIVQQVTGETVFNYLMPRIFKPLGIRGIDWDLNPQGISMGMIGLSDFVPKTLLNSVNCF